MSSFSFIASSSSPRGHVHGERGSVPSYAATSSSSCCDHFIFHHHRPRLAARSAASTRRHNMFTSRLPCRRWRADLGQGALVTPRPITTQDLANRGVGAPASSGTAAEQVVREEGPPWGPWPFGGGTSEADRRKFMMTSGHWRCKAQTEVQSAQEQRSAGAAVRSGEAATEATRPLGAVCAAKAASKSPHKRWCNSALGAKRMKWTRKRADMPVRMGPRSRAKSDDPGHDDTALKELKRGVYSATARKSTAARLDWWIKRAARRGREPFPIDLEALTLAGALLKAGRYRSSQQYLYTIRKEHVARGTSGTSHWTTPSRT